MRPYEIKKGSTDRLHRKWEKICIDFVSGKHLSHTRFKQICRTIIHDFDRLPIDENLKKPKVGIVGEILVKFLPAANNHLAELLEQESILDAKERADQNMYEDKKEHKARVTVTE